MIFDAFNDFVKLLFNFNLFKINFGEFEVI